MGVILLIAAAPNLGLATDDATTQQRTLNAALHLRELLFDVFVQIADQTESVGPDAPNSDAAHELGKVLHAAEQARILDMGDEGLAWRWRDPQDPMRAAAELWLIAKGFISNCDYKRRRKCAMHDCGVLFLDLTPAIYISTNASSPELSRR